MVRLLNRILCKVGIQIKKSNSLLKERAFLDLKYNGAVQIFDVYKKCRELKLNSQIEGMLFSKDRAMQLHALLTSYVKNVINYCPLIIIYKCTNDKSKNAYKELQKEFSSYTFEFVEEQNFNKQVIGWLSSTKADRIFFMTDDGVFLDHYDLSDCLNFNPIQNIFSLHHGTDLDFCFSHNKDQQVPSFLEKNINGQIFNSWIWEDLVGSPDWIYPLSVDAIIFCTKEIRVLLNHILFKSPNSLESQFQLYNDFFIQRAGICYPKVKYVNVPCNRVQTEYSNNSTDFFSVDQLLERFLKGQRVDWKKLEKFKAKDGATAKFSFI